MTKTFQVESKGKLSWRVVRQAAHDPQYKIGSRIPGLGKVVAVAGEITPAMEDALKQFIRPMVDRGRDWQEIAFEAVLEFDWLTAVDDWDYVVGIVTDIEQGNK